MCSNIFDDEVIINRVCGGDNIVWAENQRENDDDGFALASSLLSVCLSYPIVSLASEALKLCSVMHEYVMRINRPPWSSIFTSKYLNHSE
ncbi:hypothetical protein MKW98_007457, partial [Papaver atlanticum]